MPIHDWTRVTAGTFHSFHLSWIAQLLRTLNHGVLPAGYYAQAEQVAHGIVADVLTLERQRDSSAPEHRDVPLTGGDAGVAVATAPPDVSVSDIASEAQILAARRREIAIRHVTGDHVVALIEIVSPGNKQRRPALNKFIDKAVAALEAGYHLIVLDLFPPGQFDPQGMHAAIWECFGGTFSPPPDRPLTVASYAASPVRCFVEPCAVGVPLIPMPLFLDPEHYVNVPLEATYMAAYDDVPERWRRVIEGRGD